MAPVWLCRSARLGGGGKPRWVGRWLRPQNPRRRASSEPGWRNGSMQPVL